MRILIPIHTFLPQSPFGAERYAHYVARFLQSTDCQVHLLFTERGDRVETRQFDGIGCTVLPQQPADVESLSGRYALAESQFTELLSSFKPDIVHFNHVLRLSTRLPELAACSGAKTVFTLHDYWLRCPAVKLVDYWGRRCVSATPWKCASCCRSRFSSLTWPPMRPRRSSSETGLRNTLKELHFQLTERPRAWQRLRARDYELRRMLGYVDRFIAPVNFLRERMMEWGIPEDKIMVCDYGTERLAYQPRDSEQPNPSLRFGFLGALTELKGIDVLLQAFADISEAELIIFGPVEDAFRERFACALNNPRITLGGSIDDEHKVAAIPQLDALIVPSIWYENSPLVIHEAFQAGVPVICSNIGGMAELVKDGVDGLHFEVGNADSLRQVIRNCIATPQLLTELRSRVQPPKSMQDHVLGELLPLYCSLLADPCETFNYA